MFVLLFLFSIQKDVKIFYHVLKIAYIDIVVRIKIW